jgi:hypothetical protein
MTPQNGMTLADVESPPAENNDSPPPSVSPSPAEEENKNDSLPPSIIVPDAMKPVIERLHRLPDLSRDDLISIVFVIRLVNAMHSCFHMTQLTLQHAADLKEKLNLQSSLDVELEVYATRFSWNQGQVSCRYRIAPDFDAALMYVLPKISKGVLSDKVTVEKGLALINEAENATPIKAEVFYRRFPGRAWALILLASSSCGAYFDGTWADVGFAAISGLVSSLFHWLSARDLQIAIVQDILVSVSAAMISTGAMTVLSDGTCFAAQVLGALFWFLYGVTFFVSLYEIFTGLLVMGVSRLMLALVNSFALAFGGSIGLWIAAYGGSDRFTKAGRSCSSELDYRIEGGWVSVLYILSGVAACMQLKVKLRHFPLCMFLQFVAVGSQYLIRTTWDQPAFIANVGPAFLVTLVSHFLLVARETYIRRGSRLYHNAYRHRKRCGDLQTDKETERGSHGIEFDNRSTIHLHYPEVQRGSSDLWFSLLPAIYLLVPGSGILRNAFNAILVADNPASRGGFLGSMFVIGMSQALGVRLGLSVISLVVNLRTNRGGRIMLEPTIFIHSFRTLRRR